MTCPKCDGRMIPEVAFDMNISFIVYKCLNCGKITYPPAKEDEEQ